MGEGAGETVTLGTGVGATAGGDVTENKRSSGSGEAGRWKDDFPDMNTSISLWEGSCRLYWRDYQCMWTPFTSWYFSSKNFLKCSILRVFFLRSRDFFERACLCIASFSHSLKKRENNEPKTSMHNRFRIPIKGSEVQWDINGALFSQFSRFIHVAILKCAAINVVQSVIQWGRVEVDKFFENRIPASSGQSESIWDADRFLDTVQELQVGGGERRWTHAQNEMLRKSVSKFTGRGVIVAIENANELPGADVNGWRWRTFVCGCNESRLSRCGGDIGILCISSSISPTKVSSGFILVVNGRFLPTVWNVTHCTLFFADAAGLFPSALPLLPKESRQDNYPLLREKSRKSNKTSTVVWYFHSPIQGVSLFRYSLTFHGIVFSHKMLDNMLAHPKFLDIAMRKVGARMEQEQVRVKLIFCVLKLL